MWTKSQTAGGRGLLLGAVLGSAVALGAQALPRLPGPIAIPRSADSPGQVTFLHETHLDPARPDCTTCHPRPFRILKESQKARPAITHARMEQGELCGRCHDGKKAFALDEDCTDCHREP
jgi:c(7)-type cytochrome triheme protein